MAKPNCEKCIHKAVCDNYEQWIGDITGFENIRATKCPYFQESGWISVEDRLPAQKGKYLVAFHPCYWDDVKEDILVGEDSYRGGSGKRCWARNKYQRVTHWMPLPEPPKEG